jgi:CDP-6-deoxy-D-xylo-4-hexulose-3-dehydrase
MSAYPLTSSSWDDQEIAAIDRVVASRRFTMGAEVKAFETEFAELLGARFAVMVNSGSSANLLAIAGLVFHPDKLLQPGHEVVVPAVSWGTTYFPLHQLGLALRFVDVDRETLNVDLDLVEEAITPRTRAIFAVNLLGNPCDFDRLADICARHDLLLLEDNCESMGATYRGRNAGTFGICNTFSTYFSHHISTMEGGVVATDDERLYHVLISLRAHGWVRDQPPHSHLKGDLDPFKELFRFVLPGYNLRPLELQGATGRAQLTKLPRMIETRRNNAEIFLSGFSEIPDVTLQRETGESSWFGFALILQRRLAGRRSELVARLANAGIECRPIVAGNFLANPVIRHLNHSIGSTLHVAEDIDSNGLFLGNHHYPLAGEIEMAREIVAQVSEADKCHC